MHLDLNIWEKKQDFCKQEQEAEANILHIWKKKQNFCKWGACSCAWFEQKKIIIDGLM